MADAYEIKGQQITYEASADLSASMYCAVRLNASRRLVVSGSGTSSAGERIIGILQNKPTAAGRAGTVMIDGVSKAVAGAAIPLLAGGNAPVKTDASGRFIPATGSDIVAGFAVTAATAADELFSIQFSAA